MAVLGLIIIIVYVALAAFPSLLTKHEPNVQSLSRTLEAPSAEHRLGTDEFGRDVLSRVLHGARLSFTIAGLAVILGGFAGFSIGLLAGYFGGAVDTVLMRLMDVLLAMPGILLAIAIIAALGTGIGNVIIAIGIYNIPQFARLTRSTVLGVKTQDFVLASRSIGSNAPEILVRHIIPNAWSAPFVFAMLRFSTAILTASGLSFLGLGVNPPTPEWGAMLAASRGYLRLAPHLVLAYGLAISTLVLGFNALGEGLRDVFDPRTAH
jgi:peptide/nickel transport system permease protein